jgi:ketosteroid isomerase-like protein
MAAWDAMDFDGHIRRAMLMALAALLGACATAPTPGELASARQDVLATERAFARTMADRNLEAFSALIADEAVFFSGATPLRGRKEIVAGWARLFSAPTPPFAWEPDEVEVLSSGTLAFSSGPVTNPQGKVVARFNSIWRRDDTGRWRIVFDKGSDVCNCGSP